MCTTINLFEWFLEVFTKKNNENNKKFKNKNQQKSAKINKNQNLYLEFWRSNTKFI